MSGTSEYSEALNVIDGCSSLSSCWPLFINVSFVLSMALHLIQSFGDFDFFPIFVSRNKSKHPKLQKSKSSHQKLRKKMKLRIKLNLLVRKMNLIMMMTMKQYQMKKVIMKNINSRKRKRKRRKRKRNQRSRCQKAHQKKVGRMVQ